MATAAIKLDGCKGVTLKKITTVGFDHSIEANDCENVNAEDIKAQKRMRYDYAELLKCVPELSIISAQDIDRIVSNVPRKKSKAILFLVEKLRPFYDASAKEVARKIVEYLWSVFS
ncbi:hypothetical protein SAMN05216257_102387 [Meinhardsimonia xiamenensis]|jgi:hypothetical protein|uniref:Uncharacterized protein n=1 Tax=Meinhardsimonia xiamenensis TaxID=990712 RepID=A0A1G9B386_9RHOB|nr:hypothetical protein [Meinhardsimonia xiamenensis]PRX35138.1 hypothetical protein LV81_01732 [Meinhardsimonia xiamenensis]SDK34011.1 hypothetical protein SAMN05216257_102387 [Meinhardsimonia xiamenensis]